MRRTDRVALTDEFIATLPRIVVPDPEPEALVEVSAAAGVQADGPVEGDYQVPEDMDYDLVANAILGVVFKNLTASQEVQEVRGLRKELAETTAVLARTKDALAEAKQVIEALGQDLKAERKFRGQVEDEAAALSAELHELKHKLQTAGRNNGWSRVPVDAYKELDMIMRQVPRSKG